MHNVVQRLPLSNKRYLCLRCGSTGSLNETFDRPCITRPCYQCKDTLKSQLILWPCHRCGYNGEKIMSFPLQEFGKWAEAMSAKTEKSPDIGELRKKDYQIVFVYDALKEGFKDHSIIADSLFLGEAYTYDTFFKMWIKNLEEDSFPVAYYRQMSINSGAIRGELYVVKTDTLYAIDKHMNNGVKFNRIEETFMVPYYFDGTLFTMMALRGWIYVGVEDHWGELDKDKRFTPCEVQMVERDPSLKYYEFTIPFDQKETSS